MVKGCKTEIVTHLSVYRNILYLLLRVLKGISRHFVTEVIIPVAVFITLLKLTDFAFFNWPLRARGKISLDQSSEHQRPIRCPDLCPGLTCYLRIFLILR